MWQAHRTRWYPKGLEVVTVALDVDPEAARPFIVEAKPEHPSLIDSAHVCDKLFGFINVPNAVWIDEDGMIVRPSEPAHPGHNAFTESVKNMDVSTLPPEIAEILVEARKIRADHEQYLAMVEDWVENGAASPYAHGADEVVNRSDVRSLEHATAAAEFELGEWLHTSGNHAAAIPHWREAHRLFPENWTYKRQAWNFESPVVQGHTDAYEGSWFEDVKAIGAENYYPEIVP